MSNMLTRNILNWLVLLLTLVTVTRSENYHIVPVDSTDMCQDYRNGTCFTLEQFVQTDLSSGGDNLTLSFLPGDHVLTEQLLIRYFSNVHITGLKKSTAIIRFSRNGAINFVSITILSIERLSFVGAKVGPQNLHLAGLTIDSVHDVYINDCYIMDFELLNQTDIVNIANTQTESTRRQALHVEADHVYITNSVFTTNDGGAVDIESNSTLINNTEFNYNSAETGGAIEVVSGTVVITWCTFTNNKASQYGGAIHAGSGSSVNISNCELTNNSAEMNGGAIFVNSSSVSISDSTLKNNSADNYGGAVDVYSGSVTISDSKLTSNRAINKSGGAIGVYSGSATISDSTLTNNRAYNHGGAIDIDSGDVSISDSTLTNNSADRNGGAINNYSGSVSISESTLTNNSAHWSGGTIGVYSGSMTISNSTLTNSRADSFGGAIKVDSGSVSISDSTLTHNSADSNGGAIDVYSGSVCISDSTLANNSANRNGGVIGVQSGNVTISDSTLTNNRADRWGGAINVDSGRVSISDSTVTNNSADRNGGAIDNYSGSVSICYSTLRKNSANRNGGAIGVYSGSVSIFESTLTSNSADGSGGAIYGNLGSTVSISDCTLTNNTANSGGGVFLRESTLFVNEPIKIYHNTAQNGGGIYAHSSRVEFQSVLPIRLGTNNQSEIVDNIAENGAGIYAVATTIKVTQTHVQIGSNKATAKGGGMFLRQSSRLYLFKKEYEDVAEKSQIILVKLIINNNLAEYGGGIFVADDTESGACRGGATETGTQTIFEDCFIQTINLNEFKLKINYFNTFMTNNTATQSGADIYGGLLDRCTASQNAEYQNSSNGLDYIKKTVKTSTELSISSSPVQVIVCNYSQSDYVLTRKGHTYKISVMAVDQVRNPINATIRSSVITKSGVGRLKEGQAEQTVGNQCTELEYNAFSQDNSAQVELYAEGPCINLGISRRVINISFLLCTCPIGLTPIQSNIECKCDCDPVLLQYQIANCTEENGTIKLESNNNIWIEFRNTTNGTGYVVSNCAFDYCIEKPVDISLRSPDEQCAYNRSGVLCGECKSGLSLVLATSKCKECSNLYLLLLIPFALAGILLVALILVLNITIATGTIHGLIFYANILAANKVIFFPSLNNFLTVFVSWVNLDLGIETCFYDGMNSQGKVLLQLVFPAYLFLLMLLIILLSKYSDSFAKLLSNRNPVAALGTLVLLSYSKFVRFIVAALQFTYLNYPDGSTKIVWLYDGNVHYFTLNHIPQFAGAVIILTACGLFTVLLFFGQWFPRCSKVMIWTKNTYYNGFMDSYHAPFTPKRRYWVGLFLFALIAHNLVAAMAQDTSLPVLSAGCIAFGLISLNNGVYKKQLNEYLEALFLLNLGILSIGTSYVVETHQPQETLSNISMSIAFILFVIIIIYHFHHFILKKTKIWLKIKKVADNFCAADKNNEQPNNAIAMHQLTVHDDDGEQLKVEQIDIANPPPYMDGDPEEVDSDRYITPPIIRPATRPNQLRLSYLDELAPLTTEDYRPTPPPPRVNRRPATVTHTEIDAINKNEVPV